MNDLGLTLYHCLPPPLRSTVASLRGVYLRRLRYSNETDNLIEEALERERWSPKKWKAWQDERLGYVLHRAATRVPYYRAWWARARKEGNRTSYEYLENWPILEKEQLRENPTAFVADDCDIRRLIHESTSGTTGKPLQLWRSRKTVKAWYALVDARCRHSYGVSRQDRWAILGGQLVTSVNQSRPPFWVWNAPLKQLYMSSYHLAPDLIAHYFDALSRYRITYLWGYTSALYALAQEALRVGRRDLKMTVAITNAEPVFDYQRHVISEAFQCPVRETYGMAEIAVAASECQEKRLHLWPEVGLLEVLQNDQPLPDDTSGDFVCTGLLNDDMPLIRYRIGDRGTLLSMPKPCTCNSTLPMLGSVEGRVDDVLFTSDGRQIGRLDPVFKSYLPIREAQIVQESLGRLRVRYVPAPDYTPKAGLALVKHLQARMGDVEVILEQNDELPRTALGKFRAVVSNLSIEDREYLKKMNI